MANRSIRGTTKRSRSTRFFTALLKPALVLLILIVGVFAINLSTTKAQHGPVSQVTSEYFNMVFQGDLTAAQALFDTNPDDRGTKILKDKFEARFINETSELDLHRLKSPEVRAIAALFQDYWRNSLMQTANLEDLNISLKANLDEIMRRKGIESDLGDEDELWENVEDFMEEQGYFALSGRTPPLYELAIWMENDTQAEEIELTDGVVKIPVTSVSDFVSDGWMSFSTYGMTSLGGWAEEEGLYCVCQHYDKDSERYKLSFLKHEGRHYVDFQLYPNLKAPDLEYRAKLTELVYAEESTYALMTKFTRAASNTDKAPHPLANWHVINKLSAALLDGQFPTDSSVWTGVSVLDIRNTALQLLSEHDALLQQQGASTTEGTIASHKS